MRLYSRKLINEIVDTLVEAKKSDEFPWVKTTRGELEDTRSGAPIIHETPDYVVRRVDTHPAMRVLGSKTSWCTVPMTVHPGTGTTGFAMFHKYKQTGNLYHLHDRNSGERRLIHFDTDQFKDENDHSVEPEDLLGKYGDGLRKAFKEDEQQNAMNRAAHHKPSWGMGTPSGLSYSSPFADPEHLHNAGMNGEMLSEVLRNPSTPAKTIVNLFQGTLSKYAESLATHQERVSAANKATGSYHIQFLPDHQANKDNLRRLISHPNFSDELANKFLDHPVSRDENLHSSLMYNPNLSSNTLDRLASGNTGDVSFIQHLIKHRGYSDESVRKRVLGHLDKQSGILTTPTDKLETQHLMQGLWDRENIDPETFHSIVTHKKFRNLEGEWGSPAIVQKRFLQHPAMPEQTKAHLIEQVKNPNVDLATKNLYLSSLLTREKGVQPSTEEIEELHKAAEDHEIWDKTAHNWEAFANHENTPSHILYAHAHPEGDYFKQTRVARAALKNPNFHPDQLHDIVTNYLLPKTSEDERDDAHGAEWAHDSRDKLFAALSNPSMKEDTLDEILVNHHSGARRLDYIPTTDHPEYNEYEDPYDNTSDQGIVSKVLTHKNASAAMVDRATSWALKERSEDGAFSEGTPNVISAAFESGKLSPERVSEIWQQMGRYSYVNMHNFATSRAASPDLLKNVWDQLNMSDSHDFAREHEEDNGYDYDDEGNYDPDVDRNGQQRQQQVAFGLAGNRNTSEETLGHMKDEDWSLYGFSGNDAKILKQQIDYNLEQKAKRKKNK